MSAPRLGLLVLVLGLSIPSTLVAQDAFIAGTVVVAGSLRPVEGALVSVPGTAVRARSDAAGRFLLPNLSGSTVTVDVRMLGYRPLLKAVAVGDRGLRLALTPAAVELDAIVVTGTAGGTETRAVGNDVGTINVADVLQAAPVSDAQQLVNARLPGVLIMPFQGNVGTGARTRVRGAASLFLPNEPLIYLDGVRVDNNPRAGPDIRNRRQVARINDIAPEDIDRIEVIKGPAAAALYGTEASRGVIQILTREGTEGPLRLGVTVKQGGNWFMNPGGRLPTVYLRDSVSGVVDSMNVYLAEQCSPREAAHLIVDSLGTCVPRPIFQTGHVQSYGLTAGGGAPAVRYYLSTSLDRDEGVVSYNWRRRLSARANVSLLPSERVDVRTSLGFVHSKTRFAQPAELWDLMTLFRLASPLTRYTPLRGFGRTTPENAATVESLSETARFIGGLRFRHQPARWLTQQVTLGADVGDETSSRMFPRHPDGDLGPFGGLSLGDRAVDRWRVTYTTFDYLAGAEFDLAPPLSAATSFGAQYYAKWIRTVQATGSNFPLGVTALAGAAVTSASEQLTENRTLGMYAQQRLGWKNRVFLTAALRADDNSAFGENFDFVIYPKLAATWIVSEGASTRFSLVNALKVRAAWGQAGQQPEAFAAIQTYAPATGPGNTSVLVPQNLGNPDLKPERGEELELGFDAGLLDDRVGITFTYFQLHARDALVPRLVSPSTGFAGSQLVNVGTVRNRGIELALNARLIDGASVAGEVGVTFSTSRSRVQDLGGLPAVSLFQVYPGLNGSYDGQYHQQGFPVAAYFLPRVAAAALDSAGRVVNVMCAGGEQLGLEDPGGLVPCATAPRVYAGQPTPTWEGAVRATVTLFRNFRLYGLADLRGGHVMHDFNASNAHTSNRTRESTVRSDPEFLAYEQLRLAGIAGSNIRSGLIKGGFAKLREVSATYTLPASWAARIGVSRGSLTVAGRNLAILWREQKEIFGYPISDPEASYPEDLSGRSGDTLPQFAQFMVAARFTF